MALCVKNRGVSGPWLIRNFPPQTKQESILEFHLCQMILKRWQFIWRTFTFGFLWVQLLHWNGSDERKYSVARQRRDKSTRSLVSQVSGICRYLKWRMVFFPIWWTRKISATGFLGCSSTKRQLFDILFHEWRFDISNSHYMVVCCTNIFLFYV